MPSVGERDIVALGGELTVDSMVEAYRHGIFPWPVDGIDVLPWFSPEERAVLDFNDLHIPRSLARARRSSGFRFTIDKAFSEVIRLCAAVPRADHGTWITSEMVEVCDALHRAGHAHSVEAWQADRSGAQVLVGGIYGIGVGGYFSGESMFHLKPYASKLALLTLVDHLREKGLDWIDIQVLTPHMEQLGARLISRDEFLRRLATCRRQKRVLFP